MKALYKQANKVGNQIRNWVLKDPQPDQVRRGSPDELSRQRAFEPV